MTNIQHNNDVIPEYRNTKVDELTPPLQVIPRLLSLLIVALTLASASLVSTSSSISPKVTVNFSDDLMISYLLHASPTSQQCERVANGFTASIASACPDCQITSQCNVGDTYLAEIMALPRDTMTAALPNGVAAYISTDSESAKSFCANTMMTDRNILCTDAGSLHKEGVDAISKTRDGWVLLGCLLSTILFVTALSVARHKNLSPSEQAMTGHRQASAVATWISDLLAVNLAWLAISHGLWLSDPLPQSRLFDLSLLIVAVGLTLWFLISARHYARRRALYDEVRQCVNAIILAGLIHFAATAVTGAADLWPVMVLWISVLIILPTIRFLTRAVLDDLGLWRRPVVIVGTGENASSAIRAVTEDFTLGYKVLAVADPDAQGELSSSIQLETGLPVVSLDQLDQISKKVQVLIALDSVQNKKAQSIVQRLVVSNRRVHMIPSLRGLPTMGMQVSHFFSHNTVMLTMRDNLARSDFKIIKRGFDVIASGLGLLLLSPVFLVISLKVMKDGGPALYGHERIGKRGKPFKCLKFRSMHIDSQKMLRELLETNPDARAEWERDFKLREDPRITRIGKFIRETSIDELPQLINVFRGEMSLVGPRPVINEELGRYGDFQEFYLRVRPGITGLWQVSGRNDTSYEERVGLDVWYTQNWSLFYDVAILFKTVSVVFARKGAY